MTYTYRCFYKKQTVDMSGEGMTQLQARDAAAKYFRAKKAWDVSAVLLAIDGKPREHSTASI